MTLYSVVYIPPAYDLPYWDESAYHLGVFDREASARDVKELYILQRKSDDSDWNFDRYVFIIPSILNEVKETFVCEL